MLGLILDTFILVFLVKAIAEHEDDDFIKPAVIAILASITLFAASFAIASVEVGGLYILIGAILAVGVMVAAGCFILIGTDPNKALSLPVHLSSTRSPYHFFLPSCLPGHESEQEFLD